MPLIENHRTQWTRTWLRERRISPVKRLAVGASLAWLYALTSTLTAETDAPLPVAMASSPAAAAPTLVQTITNPDVTFLKFGMVAMPVLLMSAKGVLTFSLQVLLFLGSAIRDGRDAMVGKLTADMRFSKVSIAFQILGQLTTAAAYRKLAMATQCWQDKLHFEMFCNLVSQSPASITLVVGLANNFVVKQLTEAGSTDNLAARVLILTGLCIGVPIWCAFAYACMSTQLVFLLIAFPVSIKACSSVVEEGFGDTVNIMLRGKQGDISAQSAAWMTVLMSTNVLLGILWCCGGVLSGNVWHSVLLVGGILAEFLVPLCVLLVLADSVGEGSGKGTFAGMTMAFIISLNVALMISMIIPAGILEGQPGISLSDAAIEAFWGKKITKYMTYTFFVPARSEIDLLEKKYGHNSAGDILVLWLTQLISFCT